MKVKQQEECSNAYRPIKEVGNLTKNQPLSAI